jgi:hypothetical protein
MRWGGTHLAGLAAGATGSFPRPGWRRQTVAQGEFFAARARLRARGAAGAGWPGGGEGVFGTLDQAQVRSDSYFQGGSRPTTERGCGRHGSAYSSRGQRRWALAYGRFSEAGGQTAVAWSGAGRVGRYSNGPRLGADGLSTAHSETAVHLDGVSAYVLSPDLRGPIGVDLDDPRALVQGRRTWRLRRRVGAPESRRYMVRQPTRDPRPWRG